MNLLLNEMDPPVNDKPHLIDYDFYLSLHCLLLALISDYQLDLNSSYFYVIN